MTGTLRKVRNEEARIDLAFPEVFTAEHWRRFHTEEAKHTIAGSRMGSFVGTYMGTLAVIESGSYEGSDGKTYDLKEAGLDVPSYVMVWVATEGRKSLDLAVEVPKFSSPAP